MTDEPSQPEPPRQSIRARIARLIAGVEPEVEIVQQQPVDASPSALRERARAFETATVSDVMTSRVEVAAVEVTATLEEVLQLFAREAHSRMPVYHESLDEALGFIHIKDVVAELARAGWSASTLACRPLDRLKREIMFVPESMRLPDLLVQMQTNRIHIAIVIDEYGGAGGVVCLEDIVEQIVGDIEDEHDTKIPQVMRKGRHTWEIDALAAIGDVERETGLNLNVEDFEDEVDTIGGLVSALAGRVPQVGEVIEHPRGPTLEVVDADPRRVVRLRLRSGPRAAPAPLAEVKAGD